MNNAKFLRTSILKNICERLLLQLWTTALGCLLWLLKWWKNKNSHDMKIYFHSIKITLYLRKYIFIISTFFSWYQNIFSFSQNKFLFSKKHFYHIYFFHSSKKLYEFFIEYFSLEHIWSSICILKVRILLSVCKLNNITRMWKSC